MSTSGFSRWTQADVEAHNIRLQKQKPPILHSAEKLAEDAKKKSQRIVTANRQLEVGPGGIQEQIEDWLKTQSHRCWWDRKRTDVPTTSREGVPDFIITFEGVSVGMEVKRPGRKATQNQLNELAAMRRAGAKTAVVFSKDEAVEFLLSLKKGS